MMVMMTGWEIIGLYGDRIIVMCRPENYAD